jgi:hypothetical protein
MDRSVSVASLLTSEGYAVRSGPRGGKVDTYRRRRRVGSVARYLSFVNISMPKTAKILVGTSDLAGLLYLS